MASPDILDFDRLLQPISAEHPGGRNLRDDTSPDSPYYAIKDARDAARRLERTLPEKEKGEDNNFNFNKSLSDWRRVDECARTLLANDSKNLEVTAWFIEALVRLHGFAGLRDGFRLARELIARFWDDLYPLPDEEDGVIARVAPLAGLNGEEREGTLIEPIYRVELTDSSTAPPITYLDYQRYEQQKDTVARDQSRLVLDRAAAATTPDFFKTLRQDLEQCQEQFASLCRILEENCGADAVPSRYIRDALDNCRKAVRDLSKEEPPKKEEQEEEDQESQPAPPTPGGANQKPGLIGPASRDDAMRVLLQVADYFERTEPHSPLSYLLKQVVRWGHMSLPQLLVELIADEKARNEYCKLTGIRQDSQ